MGPKDNVKLSLPDASALTQPMTITGQATPKVAAYFNKGIVSAQWVSRALAKLGPKPKIADVLEAVDEKQPGHDLRNALGGLLRSQLLALLKQAKDDNGEIFAALYELNDPELMDALKALGKKCHLILANGAFKPPTNDENSEVRKEFESTQQQVESAISGQPPADTSSSTAVAAEPATVPSVEAPAAETPNVAAPGTEAPGAAPAGPAAPDAVRHDAEGKPA